MSDEITPVSEESVFRFLCDKCVPCFNECCRDLNQFLTPYDILRIKNALVMTSTNFLSCYCREHTGPESGFPIISLKSVDTVELKCPFTTPAGCKIYDDRPSSCRLYPLARGISRNRATGKITEHYMLMREPHCRGFEQDNPQPVNQWILQQGLAVYNEMNDLLMDVISIKNQYSPGPMDMATSRLFYMACYDLDEFRPHLYIKGAMDNLKIDPDLLEAAKVDDVALLKIGMEAIRQTLLE